MTTGYESEADDTPFGETAAGAADIMRMATAYWDSATLLAAVEVGLFDALRHGPQTAAQVADEKRLDARAVVMLLDACLALGLVRRAGGGYALTEAAGSLLTTNGTGSLVTAILWSRDQYAAWGRLAETVRTGEPAVNPALHLGGDPEQTRTFVRAMHERALGMARAVVRFLDLEGCRTLLDVGGGPGTYATLLARYYPGLHVTVMDLPAVTAVAREFIEEAGMTGRVAVQPGDATSGEYGAGQWDAVLFSGVLHQMSPATIGRMFAGAMRALKPGGRVLISDVMTEQGGASPTFATLFSLQMLLTSQEGGVFSAPDCARWLEEAGFTDVETRPLPPPLPYTVISARRAGGA